MIAEINITTMMLMVVMKPASAIQLSGGYSPMSLESIESALKTLRILLVIFTSLVAIGLVLEYKTPLYMICKGLLRLVSFRSNSFDRCVLRKLCWHFLGALLVTLGVIGEFWVEFKQNGAENAFSRAARQEQIDAQEDLRGSMYHAFQRTSDRTIDPFSFREALRDKAKGSVELWFDVDDREAHQYGVELWRALQRSNWNVGQPHRLPPDKQPYNGLGLIFRCHKVEFGDFRESRTAFGALVWALLVGSNNISFIPDPDQSVPEDHFVIEIHRLSAWELQNRIRDSK